METHNLINSSDYDDQHPDPNDHVDQSATHKVSFAFNCLKIDEIEANKQQSMVKSDETGHEKGENDDDEVSFAFNRLQIDENESNKQQSIPKSDETEDDEVENEDYDEEDEEEEGEFTFMCIGDDNNNSPTSEVFENGQIRHRQAFPLFDQSLLSGGDSDGERRRLPIHVPVDKVFIESPRRRSPSSTGKSTAGESPSTTLCALPTESETGAPEMNMKSNSTGFSKLWRFRDKMNRSNSDGRDAFVFLEPSRTTSSSKTMSSSSISIGKSSSVDDFDSPEKVNGGGGKAKAVKKTKKLTASAHEVYLKQKRGGGQTEDERRKRRSYLPYRPGLMGFFTNVNGGLSKNVHPF